MKDFVDLNVLLPRNAKNANFLDPPVQILQTLSVLHRSHFNIVAVNQLIYGWPKRDQCLNFDPNRWVMKVYEETSCLLGPHGSNNAPPLKILKRLTIIAESVSLFRSIDDSLIHKIVDFSIYCIQANDVSASLSAEVSSNYDIIAVYFQLFYIY